MGFLLAILGVLLVVGAVVAALAYVTVLAVLWSAGIMLAGLTLLFAYITGDPYVGFGIALVVLIVGGVLYEKFPNRPRSHLVDQEGKPSPVLSIIKGGVWLVSLVLVSIALINFAL